MAIQKLENQYKQDDKFINHPSINYEEIEGIKLRDSVFIVYPPESSHDGSEFVYNLDAIEGAERIVFDYDQDNLETGSMEVIGDYRVEDNRVLKITNMNNWHFKGFIFKDDDSWRKFLDLTR